MGVREVAAVCGVSFSTVAAVMRGDRWVRAGTREKVLEAAEAMGYQRDPAASILGARRGRGEKAPYSLVYLTAMFGHPAPGAFAQRMTGLAPAARERGFLLERMELKDGEHARQTHRRLVARGVDGIIVGPVEPKEFLRVFRVDDFCLVADDRGLAVHGFETVRANHFLAMIHLLRELAARKYRRIGVLLRRHRELHADDMARYGGVLGFRDLEGGVEALELLQMPFRREGQTEEERRMAETRDLRKWQAAVKAEVIVGFDHNDFVLAQSLGGKRKRAPDYAAMVVKSPWRGKVAGLAFDQDVVTGPLLDRLVEKIRGKARGLAAFPVETVVVLPFWEGQSLSRGPGK